MGIRVTTVVLALLIAVFSIAVVAAIAHAQEAPALASFFYGTAKYNGKIVPVGSAVIARINNGSRGSITVQTAGIYGFQETDQKLGVSGTQSTVGQKIEFFVKIPKLKEIKAAQTADWMSGEETKLDLTFNGQEIIDNSTQQIENKTKETVVFNLIIAGKPVVAFIDNPDMPIMRLQLVTLVNLTNVTVDFEVVDHLPSAIKALDGVYKYLSISAPKLKQADIKTAILRFKVSNGWFSQFGYDPSKVRLYRYSSNQWNALETFHEGDDVSDNYYRSATPGFSYFAIKVDQASAKKSNQTVLQEQPKEETPKEEKKPADEKVSGGEKLTSLVDNKITAMAVEQVKTNPAVQIALVAVGILIGILLTYVFVLRKNEGNGRIEEVQPKEEQSQNQENLNP